MSARKITLTEPVIVTDAYGTNYLPKGTRGEVLEENEETLTLVIGRNTYPDIPIASTKELLEDAA